MNKPEAVARAVNKKLAFNVMKDAGVSVPVFWTSAEQLPLPRDFTILARTILSGSSGDGIVVCRPADRVPDAPLYVRYVPKQHEYRVHVVLGEAILVQQKRGREGSERTEDQSLIRNYDNGWVFAVNNVVYQTPDTERKIKEESIKAVAALGLDFGAVDIIVAKRSGEPYVLEVNTAPGIESPTLLEAYKRKFDTEFPRRRR